MSPLSSPVVLGTDDTTGAAVTISQLARRQGLYMIGVNGTGKSTLIANLIVQDMQQGLGLCLLDPHGDLAGDVLARAPRERVKDIILLDLMDSGYPFGLNLFECPDPNNLEVAALTAAFVMHVFEKVWDVGPHTPQLAQVLRNVTFTLIQNPGTTLAELPLLLQGDDARSALTAQVANPQVRLFWQTYNKLRPHDQMERSSSTLNKADAFLTQPIIANIIGQAHTTIDFRKIMDGSKILLVQLSPRLEDMSMLVGAVIIGQLLNAAMGRRDIPEAERRQFNLYADEYQRFATEDFATLLSEARKFAVATTIAHQYLDQLDHANRGASVNAANLAVFRVSGQDAQELAREFDATPPPPLVIGQRPILTPKQDVVGHLMRAGHKSPVVTEFVKSILTPLVADMEEAKKARMDSFPIGPGVWTLPIGKVNAAFRSFNTLLYEAMAQNKVDATIPDDVLVLVVGQTTSAAHALMRYVSAPYQYIRAKYKPKEEFKLFTRPVDQWQIAGMRKDLAGWNGRLSREQQQFDALIAVISLLRAAMQALAVEPILVDTGQHEPILDKPRAYQDVENEIATRLAKAEPAWDPIYKEGQEFRLDQIDGMPGVGLEVFPDHEVVRVTTRNMTALTFPTRAVPHIEDGAVVFTNREGRLTVHAHGEVLWERVPDTIEARARQASVPGSTSHLDRHPSGPQKASEAVVPAQQDLSKPGVDGHIPRTTTAETKEERVELTGRVGRTPTFHTTAKGTLVASFPVAVHLEDGSTTWHKIAAFKDKARKLQDQVAQGKVVTGKEVDVVGYVHYREKQSKNGKTTRVREIWAAGPVRPR